MKVVKALLLVASLTTFEALGQEAQRVTAGVWRLASGQESLMISLADELTEKQKKLVNGGFTTLSQLDVKLLPDESADPDDLPVAISVRCSAKYDAWEETYDVALIASEPRTALVKTFDEYAGMCLVVDIVDERTLTALGAKGGSLWAQLVIKQTSAEEAKAIRDWLIEQQSGVMQRLFSHMLGELTLNHVLTVRVGVPPRPELPAEAETVPTSAPDVTPPANPRKG